MRSPGSRPNRNGTAPWDKFWGDLFATVRANRLDGDDYLIRALMETYASTDVRGYGSRLRRLRRDFLYCSLHRAHELRIRLSVRKRGDRLSELFHDRLSHGGRAILLRVLALRS